MPSRGMECHPIASGDDAFAPNGEIQLEVSHTSGNSNRSGGYEGAENDYAYDESTDQYHFVGVSDEQMSVDPHSSGFNEEAYLNAMVEADPVISEAIQWGTKNLPAELIDQYNEVIENTDDLEELHKAVNWIVDTYNASAQQVSELNPEPEAQQFSQPEEEEADEAYADRLEGFSQDASMNGDAVLADILEQMSLVERGEISREDSNDLLITKYGMEEIMEAFDRFE